MASICDLMHQSQPSKREERSWSYVVSSVRVIVNTAKECNSGVLAHVFCNHVTTTWVLVEEARNIVDEASDEHKCALLRLFLDCGGGHPTRQQRSHLAHIRTVEGESGLT